LEESSTLTYLVSCCETNEAVLIDPVLEQKDRDLQILKAHSGWLRQRHFLTIEWGKGPSMKHGGKNTQNNTILGRKAHGVYHTLSWVWSVWCRRFVSWVFRRGCPQFISTLVLIKCAEGAELQKEITHQTQIQFETLEQQALENGI
jgi:hypothetical protein